MNKRKVGFVLCSSVARPLPSTRIAVLNMLPYLEASGWETCILFEASESPDTANLAGVTERAISEKCDVVVFQKIGGARAVATAQSLGMHGLRTVFAVCDKVDVEMAASTDATIIVTDFLKSLYPSELQSRIYVVHDGIESPSVCKSDWTARGRTLSALLVTSHTLDHLPVIESPPHWLSVRIVGDYKNGIQRLREAHWKWSASNTFERRRYFRFLLNRRIACVPWGPNAVYRELINADIGIIPIGESAESPSDAEPPFWMRKSENRLTLQMSTALPVIATPIPSYEAIIDHGRNGYLARTRSDWSVCLTALRDPARRREMGLAARASVERKYSKEEQAGRLLRALDAVINQAKVSIPRQSRGL
jgi:hypothetical protein